MQPVPEEGDLQVRSDTPYLEHLLRQRPSPNNFRPSFRSIHGEAVQGALQEGNGMAPHGVPEPEQSKAESPVPVYTYADLNIIPCQPDLAHTPIVPARQVVTGTMADVESFLQARESFKRGKRGVMVDTSTCKIVGGHYEEGQDFSVDQDLGKGANGKVSLCTDKRSQQKFARKEVFKSFHDREVNVLMRLHHINIVRFFGIIQSEGKPEIYLEYAGDDLNKLIQKPDIAKFLRLPQSVASLAQQGLQALDFIHDRGILHLDVKPGNICISTNPQLHLKMADFGSCKVSLDRLTIRGWTAEYMSPEACQLYEKSKDPTFVLPADALTGKTDVYSLGASMSFLLCGKHLLPHWFEDQTKQRYSLEARQTMIQMVVDQPELMKLIAQKMTNLTSNERDFLDKTLAGRQEERSSAKDALNFVRGVMLPQSRFEKRPTGQQQQQQLEQQQQRHWLQQQQEQQQQQQEQQQQQWLQQQLEQQQQQEQPQKRDQLQQQQGQQQQQQQQWLQQQPEQPQQQEQQQEQQQQQWLQQPKQQQRQQQQQPPPSPLLQLREDEKETAVRSNSRTAGVQASVQVADALVGWQTRQGVVPENPLAASVGFFMQPGAVPINPASRKQVPPVAERDQASLHGGNLGMTPRNMIPAGNASAGFPYTDTKTGIRLPGQSTVARGISLQQQQAGGKIQHQGNSAKRQTSQPYHSNKLM